MGKLHYTEDIIDIKDHFNIFTSPSPELSAIADFVTLVYTSLLRKWLRDRSKNVRLDFRRRRSARMAVRVAVGRTVG
jgi:hypothetical protein